MYIIYAAALSVSVIDWVQDWKPSHFQKLNAAGVSEDKFSRDFKDAVRLAEKSKWEIFSAQSRWDTTSIFK